MRNIIEKKKIQLKQIERKTKMEEDGNEGHQLL